MDLKNLFNKGKKMADDRGGVDSLKATRRNWPGSRKAKEASPTKPRRLRRQ